MPPGLITDIAEIEEIRELSSSRFGAVRLVRRRSEKGDSSELFAAKFYNAGDSKENRSTFIERMQPFIYMNHAGVMPIRGMIAPTKGTGPIVLTPYSESGSLEDVLNRVRKNDPPSFWNNTTITKIIFSLITGLEYLHRQGIVHRELKPSDIIVYPDGMAKVDGYLTSYLEEHKMTKATQVGSPFYMAPEVYEGEEEGVKSRDPKTDVFSFGLIGFELVAIARVFPASMAAATIMRKVMNARRDDRPKMPGNVPSTLSDLIQRCWVPLPSKRPTFADILIQMNKLEFRFFPDVSLRLMMPLSTVAPTSKPPSHGLSPDRQDDNRT
jgi:serine/threonine-protein kinase 11